MTTPPRTRRQQALTVPPGATPEMSALVSALRDRRSTAVAIIIAVNVAVLILMEVTGGSTRLSNLIRFGAKDNDLVAAGQYWRLFTSMFLHIGFIHLVFNSLALWTFGRDLERVYGTGRFLLLYLLPGLAGSYASFRFSPYVSAGASGAIFGLIGVSLVFGFKYRSAIPVQLRSRFGTGVIPVIAYNVLYGLNPRSHIDNFAHLGGLAAGILLTLVLPAAFDIEDPLIR
jgi:rhomboid protease GluP